MQCNIDRRGRIAHLVCGLVTLAVAAGVFAVAAWAGGAWWQWLIASLLALLGAFQIYEARAGWCVTRALGIRTPM